MWHTIESFLKIHVYDIDLRSAIYFLVYTIHWGNQLMYTLSLGKKSKLTGRILLETNSTLLQCRKRSKTLEVVHEERLVCSCRQVIYIRIQWKRWWSGAHRAVAHDR